MEEAQMSWQELDLKFLRSTRRGVGELAKTHGSWDESHSHAFFAGNWFLWDAL